MPQARTALFLTSLLLSPLQAQDGQQLYTLYCSACHGVDGMGANEGAFPPLAGSPWVHGNPKRSVAIVLKGLHGPIEVNGKSYNLEMPPQGAALDTKQVQAILNYVHTAWGNKGEKVPGDLVNVVRAEYEDRAEPWTAPELLKLFPLPKIETTLANLTSRVYKGQWDQLPDFNKIQAENIEEEHSGLLSTSIAGMKDGFGIVWEGDFMAPKAGTYEFNLDADDGARLILNGEAVATVNGVGPINGKRAKEGKATLKEGANKFRVEYFEASGEEGIALGWKHSGTKDWKWLSEGSGKPSKQFPSIPLAPKDGKTVQYRNFIEGTTPRAIGFGFPGGANLVYSADHLAPELVWSGDFMDAGRHWTNRGQGNQPPSGKTVTKLTTQRFLPSEARFRGYSLDPQGNPTFKVTIGDQVLSDSWKPGPNKTLLRTLTLEGGTETLEIRLGKDITITGAETATLAPGRPTTITYSLK